MALPSGVVAFLLLDVEASTRGWNVAPAAMELALEALDSHVRSIVHAHDGVVVKARGEGDSHFCAFGRASAAVSCAAAIQRRPDQRLAVRAAVVLGEAEPRAQDYVGAVVNHGARIRSTAHGGQIVATPAIVEVTTGRLATDLTFRSLGPHQVSDIPGTIELFQLSGPGLRRSFPPLRTPSNKASAMMAVAFVDEVGAVRHFGDGHDDLVEWQRALIRTLRDLSERYDGRYLKFLGDGCVVAFEDPRSALRFAEEATDRLPVRSGMAVGVVDIVEGELAGQPVLDAARLAQRASQGDINVCPLTRAMCRLTD